jgi:hypothetical protein
MSRILGTSAKSIGTKTKIDKTVADKMIALLNGEASRESLAELMKLTQTSEHGVEFTPRSVEQYLEFFEIHSMYNFYWGYIQYHLL